MLNGSQGRQEGVHVGRVSLASFSLKKKLVFRDLGSSDCVLTFATAW